MFNHLKSFFHIIFFKYFDSSFHNNVIFCRFTSIQIIFIRIVIIINNSSIVNASAWISSSALTVKTSISRYLSDFQMSNSNVKKEGKSDTMAGVFEFYLFILFLSQQLEISHHATFQFHVQCCQKIFDKKHTFEIKNLH